MLANMNNRKQKRQLPRMGMQRDNIGCASTACGYFVELWQLAMEASHTDATAEAHSANLGHHAGSIELFLAAGWWF